MFLGVVPNACIAQMLYVVDFGAWPSIYTCCSGTFRIERAILNRHPEARIHANDVSLYTTALGRLALGEDLGFRFVGELAFIEDELGLDAEPAARVAALMVALEFSRFAAGKPNAYKTHHVDHYRTNFLPFVGKQTDKLKDILPTIKLQSFSACDWREHVEHGIAAGAGIAAFPPFYKGGYETMFRFLNDNIEWQAPDYNIYDPSDLKLVLERLIESGVPYCLLSDQRFDDHQPSLEFTSGRLVPHYCYTREDRSSYRRLSNASRPFAYKPIDLATIGPESQLTLKEVDAKAVNYIKDVYLQKSIVHSSGLANFLVFIDDQLAGALVFDLPNQLFGDRSCLYLLSDLAISRDGKLSKLIARLATSRTLADLLSKRYVRRFERIITTAFTDKPVSMKYRGAFKVIKRQAATADRPAFINYASDVRDETPQQIYTWWWDNHGQHATRQSAA